MLLQAARKLISRSERASSCRLSVEDLFYFKISWRKKFIKASLAEGKVLSIEAVTQEHSYRCCKMQKIRYLQYSPNFTHA